MLEPNTKPSPAALVVVKNGQPTVAFDPTPAQLPIMLECVSGKWPNVFVWGNRGGGKSYMARWLAHILALTFPNFRYKIIRRRFGELQENHLDFLTHEMELLGGEYNKTEHTTRYSNGSIGYFRPCATPEDAEKAIGTECYLLIFDESPTLEWEHTVLITGSVRVPEKARRQGVKPLVLHLGNPIGPSVNQLWSYFINKDVSPDENDKYFPADYHAIELRLEQNPYQDIEAYKRRLASQTDPQYRRAWLEGERSFEQALFDFKPSVDGKPYHVIPELPSLGDGKSVLMEPWVRIYRAYDHGFYPDPAVCLWFAVAGKRIIVFKEQVWYRTDALQIARDILQGQVINTGYSQQILPVSATYVDPSLDLKMSSSGVQNVGTKAAMEGVSITVDGQRIGLPLDTSINSREQFASAIHRALAEEVEPGIPRLQIVASECPYLIKALPQQRYDEHNPAKLADHKHDHPVVALAYFLLSYIPETAPPPINRIPQWLKELRSTSRNTLGNESVRRRY
jgi:hypothetical protein